MNHRAFLPNFSVNRPVTVIMMLAAILVVGVISYSKIKLELMPPGFTPPFLRIYVPYPNANPQEVEEQIARPIEEMMQTVRNVTEIESSSRTDGAFVWLSFQQDADMSVAYNMVRDRLERVKPELPSDVERTYIRTYGDDDIPILIVGIQFEEEFEDPYYLVDTFVKKPLERIDGVANVSISGLMEKEILIDLDMDKIKAMKIDVYGIIQNLQQDNFSLSSGYLKEGGKKIYVRSLGKFSTLEEIRDYRVRGTDIRLSDIAVVRYDEPEVKSAFRLNFKKAVAIEVQKESMANVVDINNKGMAVLRNEIMKNPKLEGMKFDIFFDQGSFIKDSIDNLEEAGAWGGLFAFFILLFFLRRGPMTLLITLAIPLSLVITVIVIYFIGWSLNIITLSGMMICVGLVVDNSIVIVENIYRRRQLGDHSTDAAIKGASEVSLAITMATLTTVVVFLPLILMNDDSGMTFYMLRIGLPVMTALLGSLFVALVFIPLVANKLPIKGKIKEARIVVYGRNLYERVLKWTLTHRFDAALIGLALLFSISIPMDKVDKSDGASGSISDFRVIADLPDNYSLEDAGKLFLTLEHYLDDRRDTYNIRMINTYYRKDWGRIEVYAHADQQKSWWYVSYRGLRKMLGIPVDNKLTTDEIVEDIKENAPQFPGVRLRTSWHNEDRNDGSVRVYLYGRDTNTLVPYVKEVERRFSTIPDILNVETSLDDESNEVHIVINRELAKKYGVSPFEIAGLISYVVRGVELPDYRTEEKEIDVRIQLQKEDRETLHQLKNIMVTTESGKDIPLSALVTFRIEKGTGSIYRHNGRTCLSVMGYTTKSNVDKLYKQIDKSLEGFELPLGYTWDKGARFQRMQNQTSSQQFAVYLAITFVFLLMGVLFESFVLPLSIIICIPFSFFGAFWGLYLTGTSFDLMASIGLIILIGVVVNNAIVLVDLVNRFRNEGMERFEALIEAGKNRFRPIMMTAFTTMFGLIPMALGDTAIMKGIPYAPLGRTIIGGLFTSTFFTLIFVPLTYTYLDDLRTTVKSFVEDILIKVKGEKMEPIPVKVEKSGS